MSYCVERCYCKKKHKKRLKSHLVQASRKYPWTRVIIVKEPWTSKICGKCGHINHALGGSKIFTCINSKCKMTFGRDANAPRNILLRHLTVRAIVCKQRQPESSSTCEDDSASCRVQDSNVAWHQQMIIFQNGKYDTVSHPDYKSS